MTQFLLALVIFLLAHSLPAATGLRAIAIGRFGKSGYITAYSIVSIALLGWLIWSALQAPYFALWHSSSETSLVAIIAMLPASLIATAALLRPNSLSIAFVSRHILPGNGLTAFLRHPLLWALFLWSLSHVVANGDVVSLLLFGGLAVFSLAGMKIMERRAQRNLSTDDFNAAKSLTTTPFAARMYNNLDRFMLLELAAGLVIYNVLLHAHQPVIGVDPLAHLLP